MRASYFKYGGGYLVSQVCRSHYSAFCVCGYDLPNIRFDSSMGNGMGFSLDCWYVKWPYKSFIKSPWLGVTMFPDPFQRQCQSHHRIQPPLHPPPPQRLLPLTPNPLVFLHNNVTKWEPLIQSLQNLIAMLCMCWTGPFEFRWLKGYIYNPSYYYHQIGSIHLSHCCHIFPWMCVWDGCTTIFCHL